MYIYIYVYSSIIQAYVTQTLFGFCRVPRRVGGGDVGAPGEEVLPPAHRWMFFCSLMIGYLCLDCTFGYLALIRVDLHSSYLATALIRVDWLFVCRCILLLSISSS